MENHPYEDIISSQIAELFNNAYIRIANPEKAIKDFEKTRICPYNPDIFKKEDFEAANHDCSNNTRDDDLNQLEVSVNTGSEISAEVSKNFERSNVTFKDILPLPRVNRQSG